VQQSQEQQFLQSIPPCWPGHSSDSGLHESEASLFNRGIAVSSSVVTQLFQVGVLLVNLFWKSIFFPRRRWRTTAQAYGAAADRHRRRGEWASTMFPPRTLPKVVGTGSLGTRSQSRRRVTTGDHVALNLISISKWRNPVLRYEYGLDLGWLVLE